jgi:hypothetical protein
MRLVERGTDEVVHGSVGDDECLFAVALDVEHARYEGAGLRDEKTTGLDHDASFESLERILKGRGVLGDLGGRIESAAVVIDAETATCIDALEVNAFAAQLIDKLSDSLHCLSEWLC